VDDPLHFLLEENGFFLPTFYTSNTLSPLNPHVLVNLIRGDGTLRGISSRCIRVREPYPRGSILAIGSGHFLWLFPRTSVVAIF
jgi:hypothetical protein